MPSDMATATDPSSAAETNTHRAGGDRLAEAVLRGVRDQVGADQATGRVAADEEAPGQQPEVAGPGGLARRRASGFLGRALLSRLVGAEGPQADLFGPIAHEQGQRDERRQGDAGQHAGRAAPAGLGGQRHRRRQEQQLAGRAGRADRPGGRTHRRQRPPGPVPATAPANSARRTDPSGGPASPRIRPLCGSPAREGANGAARPAAPLGPLRRPGRRRRGSPRLGEGAAPHAERPATQGTGGLAVEGGVGRRSSERQHRRGRPSRPAGPSPADGRRRKRPGERYAC